MKLRRLHVRFYKAFNFDYELKANPDATTIDWQKVGDSWYPFVSIDLEKDVTAVVGANESGKSQLLEAIVHLLDGTPAGRETFCRYSPLYSVELERRRSPDFGGTLLAESDEEKELLTSLGVPEAEFEFYRLGDGSKPFILSATARVELTTAQLGKVQSRLPRLFRIDTKVALPDNVPYAELGEKADAVRWTPAARHNILSRLFSGSRDNEAEFVSTAPDLYKIAAGAPAPDTAGVELGRDLLLKIGRIDPSAFDDLAKAMSSGGGGPTEGLVQRMNDQLDKYLNFPRWWAQDSEFRLKLSPHDYELGLTVLDRTGMGYSFAERSTGLQYFLSYYVQLLAHEKQDGRDEILLLDEPDAFLSSSGQQDLLRLLEDFARPERSSRRDQVVYVTHSPFMLNKNAGYRIRVLDKGVGDEGTRVVRDATKGHYEPIRSSLGSYVAETAFIGGSNILVEGSADQVLLAGVSNLLRRRDYAERDCIDLNTTTIVACGSAASVPYVAYLARGRDQFKPACVVLLDGDAEGHLAAKKVAKSEANGRQILPADLVLLIDEWVSAEKIKTERSVKAAEIEDLLSVDLAVEAAQAYARHYLRLPDSDTELLEPAKVRAALAGADGRLYKALSAAFQDAFDTTLDKVGFARETVAAFERDDSGTHAASLGRIASLIQQLAAMTRDALSREDDRRQTRQVGQVINSFLRDYPDGARRDDAVVALDALSAKIDDPDERAAVVERVAALKERFHLEDEPGELVPDFPQFREAIQGLRYQGRRVDRELAD